MTINNKQSFAEAAPAIAQSALGAYNSIQGIHTTASGGTLAAQQFQIAASSDRSVAAYNAQLARINATRAINAANSNLSRTVSDQQVQMASSGVSITSKSFLAVANETLDVLTREILNFKFDAEQQQQSILFSGEASARSLENKALQAKFQGNVSSFGQAQQAGQQLAGLGSSVITLAAQNYRGAG